MRWAKSPTEIRDRIKAVAESPSEDFRQLIRLAGLDPSRDLRFHDWSGTSFAKDDLRGFDFTGARLIGCNFAGSIISGARFDQTVFGYVGDTRWPMTDLRLARDWASFARGWDKPGKLATDGQLRPGMIFQDAPFAPRMVVIPAGEVHTPEETTHFDDAEFQETLLQPRKLRHLPRMIAVSEWQIEEREYSWFRNSNRLGALLSRRWPFARASRSPCRVGRDDAMAYVDWLAEITGQAYRMLSSDELAYCLVGRWNLQDDANQYNPNTATENTESFGLKRVDPSPEWHSSQRRKHFSRTHADLPMAIDQELLADTVIVGRRGIRRWSWGAKHGFRVARELYG